MKKWGCIIFTVVFIILLAGCGGQQKLESTSALQEKTTVATEVQKTTNEFGWVVPEETTKYTSYNGKISPDSFANWGKDVLPWIKEKFNVEINAVVYDVDKDQKISLMLAGGDYPEVLTNISEEQALRFKEQGKAIELTPMIEKHGPNIKKALEAAGVYSLMLTEDSKLYYLPRNFGLLKEPDFTADLRLDWYKEMGSPVCVTPEDYYNILKKMVQDHPKNSKNEKVYAISSYSMSSLSWGEGLITGLAGIWGLKAQYKEDADHSLTHWVNTNEGLEMTKWMNRFNLDGMLDPDMFINKFQEWRTKFSSERIAGHIGWSWVSWNAGHEVWQKEEGWNPDKRYVQTMLKTPEAEKSYMSGKNARAIENIVTIITNKAKNAEAILDWIDFCNTDTGRWIVGYGIPEVTPGDGALWKFTGGKSEFTEGPKKALIEGTIDFDKDVWSRSGVNQIMLCNSIEGVRGNDTAFSYDHAFTDQMEWWHKMIENTKDSIYDNTIMNMIQIVPSSPLGAKLQQIRDALLAGWAQCLYSKTEADCEKNFLEMREKLNTLGLKEIEKFKSDEYKKLLSKK